MTRKDFELIARVVRQINPSNPHDAMRANVAVAFGKELFRACNSFNAERFYAACHPIHDGAPRPEEGRQGQSTDRQLGRHRSTGETAPRPAIAVGAAGTQKEPNR